MIWSGPSGVRVEGDGGEVFNNVQNGQEITFSTPSKDTFLDISGPAGGSSKFHVSCSDPQMNGPEDCGSAQGNGKNDDGGLLNLWILEGISGDETLDCTP
jgi:hypothetical protein